MAPTMPAPAFPVQKQVGVDGVLCFLGCISDLLHPLHHPLVSLLLGVSSRLNDWTWSRTPARRTASLTPGHDGGGSWTFTFKHAATCSASYSSYLL
ncbi:hypothetical protein MUK42_36117 [Musa troglodytarum]|uniref:Uncharacterized protein n=1 Tax=Musa troglodytarum TaxID=320322 RepID=A0A9E7L1Q3_9LILI|nr:hypothetical protein MUK42_36117 [Musa troglodytarum]